MEEGKRLNGLILILALHWHCIDILELILVLSLAFTLALTYWHVGMLDCADAMSIYLGKM